MEYLLFRFDSTNTEDVNFIFTVYRTKSVDINKELIKKGEKSARDQFLKGQRILFLWTIIIVSRVNKS